MVDDDGDDDHSAAVPFHVVPQKYQYSIYVADPRTDHREDGKLQRVLDCHHPVPSVELSCC